MRKLSKWTLLSVMVLTLNNGLFAAQPATNNTPDKVSFSDIGNSITATDFESVYTNDGGTAVKFSFSENVYASIPVYHGMKWKNEPIKPTALPIPGTGMHVGYKSLILALALYYISNENKWKAAIGSDNMF